MKHTWLSSVLILTTLLVTNAGIYKGYDYLRQFTWRLSSAEAANRSATLSRLLNELWHLDENRLKPNSELRIKQNGSIIFPIVFDLIHKKLFDFSSLWRKETKNLFQTVRSDRLSKPTFAEFVQLLDNYQMDVTSREYFTEKKMNETWSFLNAVMQTKVMKRTHEVLASAGLAPSDNEEFKAMLFEMWFAFDRPREFNIFGSGKGQFSTFEHVFVGELNGKQLTGFHNWIQLYRKEFNKELHFIRFSRKSCSNESPFISITFEAPQWQVTKSDAYFLVGTSPEFELAAYTATFLFRVPGKLTAARCPVYLICNAGFYRDWRPSTCYPKDKFV